MRTRARPCKRAPVRTRAHWAMYSQRPRAHSTRPAPPTRRTVHAPHRQRATLPARHTASAPHRQRATPPARHTASAPHCRHAALPARRTAARRTAARRTAARRTAGTPHAAPLARRPARTPHRRHATPPARHTAGTPQRRHSAPPARRTTTGTPHRRHSAPPPARRTPGTPHRAQVCAPARPPVRPSTRVHIFSIHPCARAPVYVTPTTLRWGASKAHRARTARCVRFPSMRPSCCLFHAHCGGPPPLPLNQLPPPSSVPSFCCFSLLPLHDTSVAPCLCYVSCGFMSARENLPRFSGLTSSLHQHAAHSITTVLCMRCCTSTSFL